MVEAAEWCIGRHVLVFGRRKWWGDLHLGHVLCSLPRRVTCFYEEVILQELAGVFACTTCGMHAWRLETSARVFISLRPLSHQLRQAAIARAEQSYSHYGGRSSIVPGVTNDEAGGSGDTASNSWIATVARLHAHAHYCYVSAAFEGHAHVRPRP